MTKEEQIEEMAKYVCNTCEMGHGFDGYCAYGGQDYYKRCTLTQETAETLYEAGYRKTPNDIRELIDVLYEGAKLKEKLDEIKRLETENAYLLKACEEKFTFDTTENKKYSIFNTVRKEFADNVTAKLFAIFGKTICSDLDTEDITDKIYESLKEYQE